jgi:hypothetical protein
MAIAIRCSAAEIFEVTARARTGKRMPGQRGETNPMKILTGLVRGAVRRTDEARTSRAQQPPAGVLRAVRRRAGAAGPERVPVFRVGELTGFVRRGGQETGADKPGDEGKWKLSGDAALQRALLAAVQSELAGAAQYVGLAVEGGVVVLSGEVGNVHDKMALRRIAASMAATIAIIDDVWVSCE